jgi:type VI secretion system protein VasG
VLPYYPLSPDMLAGIVRLQLKRIEKRIAENHKIALGFAPSVVDLIVSRCNEVASGGRMIDAILTNTLLPEMSIQLLERQMRGKRSPGSRSRPGRTVSITLSPTGRRSQPARGARAA